MESINVNGVEYVKAKGMKKELVISDKTIEMPFQIGASYYMRTVTYHLVGTVKQIIGKFLVLKDASWVADSGRFMNAIKEGTLSEVEPVGTAYISTDAITDAFPWTHKLPDKQK